MNKLSENELLKADKIALVLIDLQNGIANRELAPYSGGKVVENARKLINSFSEKGAFIVLVRVSTTDGKDMVNPKTDLEVNGVGGYPEGWDILVPEIANTKNAHVVTKRQWGAFYGTDLDLQLRRRGINSSASYN